MQLSTRSAIGFTLGSGLAVSLTLFLAGCGPYVIPPSQSFGAAAVADVNGDGLADIVASYSYISGPPPHPGYVAVYLQDPTNPGHFLRASTYAAGTDATSVAVGDLDGNGKVDIVTTNSILSANGAGASTVSVLLQDPAKPGQFFPAASYATGKNPVSVAVGDIDGDGRADLAVADDSGVSLLFQSPATPGTFRPRIPLSVGRGASCVSIADLNGDGKSDLVVTNVTSVLVLLQDSRATGSFLASTSYSAGAQPLFASVGDLDGDGRPDIAVANLGSPDNARSASVSVLLQNPAAPGSFLTGVPYATDLRSEAVAIADLNGDGKADLAVANAGTLGGLCPSDCGSVGTSVSVLLQNPAVSGQFLGATTYPATGTDFITSVVIADMNGDGKPDLVITESGGVYIKFQDPLHPGQFLAAVLVQDSSDVLRLRELSYFLTERCRNQARMVSGRTIWQQALRSSGVSALPFKASRRRWSGVNITRVLPVSAASSSLRARTSSCKYSTLRAICSLSACVSIARRNCTVVGAIGGREHAHRC